MVLLYYYNQRRPTISDVDECFQDEDACSGANEECVNEQGTYSCECQSGYVKKDGVCVKKGKSGISRGARNALFYKHWC